MRVALYLRVSTEEQAKGHSLDSQRDQLSAWAEREGWEVVAAFEDAGATATDATKRPAFQRMVVAASRREFDRVLVKNRSRYARSRVDGPAYEALLNKHGVQVWSLEEPASNEDTPAGFLMKGMADLLAAHYSVDLSFKTTQGKRKRAEKGLTLGDAPFGYRRPDARSPLVVDEREAAAVLHAFERYASGTASMRDIAAELTAAGLHPRSKRGNTVFSKASVERLLANPAYLGHVTYKDEVVVRDAHPAIVPGELFDRAKAVRGRRSHGANVHHRNREYLLSGLGVCSECGSRLWAAQAKGVGYYRCSAGQRGLPCVVGMKGAPADEIEQWAAWVALSISLPADWRERIIAHTAAPIIAPVDPRPALDAKLKRLLSMMAEGVMSFDEGKPAVEETRRQLEACAPDPPSLTAGEYIDDIQANWLQAGDKERRAMLSRLAAHVVVDVRARRVPKIITVPELDPYLVLIFREYRGDVPAVSAWRPRSASDSPDCYPDAPWWARLPGLTA